ncbi:MAG: ribose-phosphate diphosphokinase [Candidatus Undinarchaeales archaeon]
MKKIVIPCEKTESLAIDIAEKIDGRLASYEDRRFPDNEFYFRVETDLKGKEAVIVQTGYPDPNSSVVELLIIADACRHHGAEKITAVIPYVPYARQDKRFEKGEAFSLETIGNLMKNVGIDKVITVDTHFKREYGKYDFFGIKAVNISAGVPLVKFIKKKFDVKELHIISPDLGASEMIDNAAKKTKSKKAKLKKVRKGDYDVEMTGKLEVKGKNVLVLDDIISTGGTMEKAVNRAKDAGAKKVFAAATHGLFVSDAMTRLKKASSYVVTTDSIENDTAEVTLTDEIVKVL